MPQINEKILWISFNSNQTFDWIASIQRTTGCQVDVINPMQVTDDTLKIRKNLYRASIIDSDGDVENLSLINKLNQIMDETICILLIPPGSPIRLAALEAGLYRLLEKPVKPAELAAIVQISIQQARLRIVRNKRTDEYDPDSEMKTLLEAVSSLIQADEINLVILDPVSGGKIYYQDPCTNENHSQYLFEDDHHIEQIIKSGRIAQTDGEKLTSRLLEIGYHSWNRTPCVGPNGTVGVLFAFSRNPGHLEKSERQLVLQKLAQQIGMAVSKSREQSEIRDHARYLDRLVEVGRQLSNPQTIEDQLELVWKYIKEEFKVCTFFVALYDRSSDILSFKKSVDENTTYPIGDRLLGNDRTRWGIAGYVAKTGQELFTPTLESNQQLCNQYHIEPQMNGKPCETCFFLPLKKGLEVIGVISIQSNAKNAFDENLQNAFRALSGQLAAAIENRRLFEIEQARSIEAEVLRKSGLQIAASMEIAKIAHCVLDELIKIVPYDCATVQLLKGDQDDQRFEIIETRGFPNSDEIIGLPFSVKGDNPNRLIFANRRPITLADAPASYPDFACGPHRQADIHSWLGVPMLVGDKLVGMIDLDKHECGFYKDEHADLVCALAVQAALSIRNAQLYERTNNAKIYMRAIFEAGNDILSITDSGQLLHAIGEKACSTSGAWRSVLFCMEESKADQQPEILAVNGFEHGDEKELEIRPQGISWRVFHTQESSFHDRIWPDDSTTHPNMYRQGVRAAACLPLVVDRQSIGVLWLHFQEARTFSDTEKEALTLFARQSAIAYSRSKSNEQITQARNEAKAVAQTATEGHLAPTLKSIVSSVAKVLKCDSVTLYVYNQDTDQFDFPPTLLDVSDESDVLALGTVSPDSVVRKILELDKAHEAENAGSDSLMAGNFERKGGISSFVTRERIASSMGIPLRIGSRKVGVMFINYKQRHPFTTDDRINVALFANQAAVAIQNAQLIEAAAKSAELLRALHDAGVEISNRLDLDDLLKSIAHRAYDLSGMYGSSPALCNISLVDAKQQKLIIKAAYPNEVHERLIARYPEVDLFGSEKLGFCGLAAKSGKTVLVQNVHAPEFAHIYIPYDKETKSELAVPILANGQVIGVINVERRDATTIDREVQSALEALAAQVAIAINNASDQKMRLKGEQVFSTSAALLSTTEPSQVLQMIVDALRRSVDAWRVVALLIDAEKQERVTLAQSGFEPAWKAAIPVRPAGISMRVVRTGKPVFKDDIHEDDPDVNPHTISDRVRAVACLPFQADGKSIGVLWIQFNEPHPFSAEERKALEMYTNQSALAYAYSKRVEEGRLTQQKLENSTALAKMGMISTVWRHSIENHAETIYEMVDLLRGDLENPFQDKGRIAEKLSKIQNLAIRILEKPITPPISSDEGVIQFDICEMLNDRLMHLWRNEYYKQANLRKDFPKDGSFLVRASPEWLRRAFDILLDNAIEVLKNRPKNDLTVSVKKASDLANVEIRFSDNGPGVPVNLMDSILKRPIPKSTGEKGIGLGLLMAQMIIQAYEGTIQLESTGADGTTFLVKLPCEYRM